MGKKRRRRANADGLEYVGDDGAASDGRSTRGPPVATTSGRLSGTVPNDEWQTTRKSWEAVVAHFAIWKDKRIWMPFYYEKVELYFEVDLGLLNKERRVDCNIGFYQIYTVST